MSKHDLKRMGKLNCTVMGTPSFKVMRKPYFTGMGETQASSLLWRH